eukprot:scaffold96283_cov21-Tisochrysis_lutea.AAC.1
MTDGPFQAVADIENVVNLDTADLRAWDQMQHTKLYKDLIMYPREVCSGDKHLHYHSIRSVRGDCELPACRQSLLRYPGKAVTDLNILGMPTVLNLRVLAGQHPCFLCVWIISSCSAMWQHAYQEVHVLQHIQ